MCWQETCRTQVLRWVELERQRELQVAAAAAVLSRLLLVTAKQSRRLEARALLAVEQAEAAV